MRRESIEFPYNARTVFTAVKRAMEDCGMFRGIRANDRTFRLSASHGLPVFGEDLELRVVATGTDSCRVEIRSADKLFYNIFKWGNNKRNVGNIADFVSNEVYRLLPSSSPIRLVQPNIRFRQP